MRELKFRAWDTKTKKWLDDVMIDLKGVPESYSDNDGGKEGLWEHALGNWKDTIISQYTGLKDKNGKEIYEGDYVKIPAEPWQDTSEIIRVYWSKSELGWLAESSESDDTLTAFATEKGEIIGNIYENPDLIGDK